MRLGLANESVEKVSFLKNTPYAGSKIGNYHFPPLKLLSSSISMVSGGGNIFLARNIACL
jgi:hypothetical protein